VEKVFDQDEAMTDFIVLFLCWLFIPTVLCILMACVLWALRIPPPKPRDDGWFGKW
jgi:tellurite resistance protein TehA-like permease